MGPFEVQVFRGEEGGSGRGADDAIPRVALAEVSQQNRRFIVSLS